MSAGVGLGAVVATSTGLGVVVGLAVGVGVGLGLGVWLGLGVGLGLALGVGVGLGLGVGVGAAVAAGVGLGLGVGLGAAVTAGDATDGSASVPQALATRVTAHAAARSEASFPYDRRGRDRSGISAWSLCCLRCQDAPAGGRARWLKNSARVLSLLRKSPRTADVVMTMPGFCTPRMLAHK